MTSRYLKHIGFWAVFVLLYAISKILFAAPSDAGFTLPIRLARYLLSELAFLPWKIIPFYALFYYLIPTFFRNGKRAKGIAIFVLIVVICILGYRTMIIPMNNLLYGDDIAFNVYSFKRLLYTLTDFIPAFGVAATAKLMGDARAAKRKEIALQAEKRNMELQFLKAQSNPHFLFNTLNNLYGIARKDGPKAAEYILSLSNQMRFILEACEKDNISVLEEIELIDEFIALEKLRFSDRLKVRFDKDIANENATIAPLILMGFVENAFKHIADKTRLDTFITIQIKVTDAELTFDIKNTTETKVNQENTGRGLPNVKRQLDLIYPERHTLEIKNENDVYALQLNIQFQ